MAKSFSQLLVALSAAGLTMALPEPHASQMTIKVMNGHTSDIRMFYTGSPVAGAPLPAVIAKGQQAQYSAVGPRWSGTVAVNDAKFTEVSGAESLIEASFAGQLPDPANPGPPIGDINISFVSGFTLPIVCWCDDNNNTTGCSKDLFKLGKCSSPNAVGACQNPNRWHSNDPNSHDTPDAFFAPCHAPGSAYTYPSDNLANNMNGKCPKEQYTCCVGAGCKQFP